MKSAARFLEGYCFGMTFAARFLEVLFLVLGVAFVTNEETASEILDILSWDLCALGRGPFPAQTVIPCTLQFRSGWIAISKFHDGNVGLRTSAVLGRKILSVLFSVVPKLCYTICTPAVFRWAVAESTSYQEAALIFAINAYNGLSLRDLTHKHRSHK